jgi:phenylpyruvate tautomerase PptA (4-oxalocrotonate tautomerase family)
MPTYMCYARAGHLTADHKVQIARGISQIHSGATGAPVSFVQCLFRDLDAGGHFIGGRPAAEDGVWVYGRIRAGRTVEVKNELLLGIRDHLTQVLGISDSLVWVYLNELTHTDMVEFGRVLPDQGGEQQWIHELPPDLRDRLNALG